MGNFRWNISEREMFLGDLQSNVQYMLHEYLYNYAKNKTNKSFFYDAMYASYIFPLASLLFHQQLRARVNLTCSSV